LLREERGSGLVYTSTIRTAKALWTALVERDVSAGIYHGELHAAVRDTTQDAFMDGRYRVIVATKAFGMGIDKPDTRFVVHYQVPGSLESYYQEVGRRSRWPAARGLLLYQRADTRVQRYFLAGKHPRAGDVEQVAALLAATAPGAPITSSALRPVLGERRAEVILRAPPSRRSRPARANAAVCRAPVRRTSTILTYFGEKAETGCDHCNYCCDG
jgi:ATP-dependent DNA helicase RecQ